MSVSTQISQLASTRPCRSFFSVSVPEFLPLFSCCFFFFCSPLIFRASVDCVLLKVRWKNEAKPWIWYVSDLQDQSCINWLAEQDEGRGVYVGGWLWSGCTIPWNKRAVLSQWQSNVRHVFSQPWKWRRSRTLCVLAPFGVQLKADKFLCMSCWLFLWGMAVDNRTFLW